MHAVCGHAIRYERVMCVKNMLKNNMHGWQLERKWSTVLAANYNRDMHSQRAGELNTMQLGMVGMDYVKSIQRFLLY